MAKPSPIHFLLPVFFLFCFCQQPIRAVRMSYIVYLGPHTHGPNPPSAVLDSATKSHHNLLASLLRSNERAEEAIIYSYNRNINGFAVTLEEEEAAELARNPNVVSVSLNRKRQLHTTRSWEFLGLESQGGLVKNNSAWAKGNYGEDTIIANLDTGVWPESKSFSDEGLGPIPSKWRGKCQFGNRRSNKFLCNRKLIGARFFIKGFEASAGKQNESMYTTRDTEGHGSHTLSTAGGSFVKGVSVLGSGTGMAKGGSPKARVAAYKVCWPSVEESGGCYDADILAGFEAAISDGVDVISVSFGGESVDLFNDAMAIGSFHATLKGITVVSSAGNSGPTAGSVTNVSPWMLTVAASTIDRDFVSYIALGDKKHLTGASLSPTSLPSQKFYPLTSSKDARLPHVSSNLANLCYNGTLDPKVVNGKILVCFRGETARTAKGMEAARAGAVGMILANDPQSLDDTVADPHVLPASNINYEDGQCVYKYISSTKNPVAYITNAKTVMPVKPSPVMAAFSSRGPNKVLPSILKPDITAPGVNIIASFSKAIGPTDQGFDQRRIPFNSKSGTSTSCPHVSGIAGLLKNLYPNWSPAAIKSSIMTTASALDSTEKSILDSSMEEDATPFAFGAGHVQPNEVMDPGLVYDLTVDDYLNFLCWYGYNETLIKQFTSKSFTCPKSYNVLDFNYPTITVPSLATKTVKVSRTVTNVGRPSNYIVDIKVSNGINVLVEPSHLRFTKVGQKKSFQVLIEETGLHRTKAYSFGEIRWTNGKNTVRSPIVVHHKL